MHRDVFGQHGDFITSPEISQMFGEVIQLTGYMILSSENTQPFYCWSGICPGPPGSAGTRKVKPRRLKPNWIYWSKR